MEPFTQEEEEEETEAVPKDGVVRLEAVVVLVVLVVALVWLDRPQELAKPRFRLRSYSLSWDTWIRFPTRWLPNVPDSGRASPGEVDEGAGNGLEPTGRAKPEGTPVEDGAGSTLDVSELPWCKLWW